MMHHPRSGEDNLFASVAYTRRPTTVGFGSRIGESAAAQRSNFEGTRIYQLEKALHQLKAT